MSVLLIGGVLFSFWYKSQLVAIESTVTVPTPTPEVTTCKIAGCSGELCLDFKAPDVATTCVFKEEFACYQDATCEVQEDGKCGWTLTPVMQECLLKNK